MAPPGLEQVTNPISTTTAISATPIISQSSTSITTSSSSALMASPSPSPAQSNIFTPLAGPTIALAVAVVAFATILLTLCCSVFLYNRRSRQWKSAPRGVYRKNTYTTLVDKDDAMMRTPHSTNSSIPFIYTLANTQSSTESEIQVQHYQENLCQDLNEHRPAPIHVPTPTSTTKTSFINARPASPLLSLPSTPTPHHSPPSRTKSVIQRTPSPAPSSIYSIYPSERDLLASSTFETDAPVTPPRLGSPFLSSCASPTAWVLNGSYDSKDSHSPGFDDHTEGMLTPPLGTYQGWSK